MAETASGAYWQGADGNYYLRASNVDGVVNLGANPSQNQSFVDMVNSGQYQQISDPVAPQQPTDLASTGGGSGTVYQDTSGARAATKASIDSIDTILGNKNASEDTTYTNLIGGYDSEGVANKEAYDKQVEGNEIDRDANHQAALAGAAQGSRGLYSTLAAIGALGGTGRVLANRAVAKEANSDLGGANRNFESNFQTLFNAKEDLNDKDKQRRLDAETTWKNRKIANENESLTTKQSLWKDMADLWSKAGNVDEMNAAMATSASLQPQITASSAPAPAQYANTSLKWGNPALAKYLAGANDMTVKTAGGLNPINGAIYTSTKKRDEL